MTHRAVALVRHAWSQRELRWLLVILVVATAVRAAWVFYAAREPQELHDPLFYKFYAEQIALGNGYRPLDGEPTAYYPVGYPGTLGLVFALVKHSIIPDNLVMATAWFNVVLSVATTGVLYGLGKRLFDGTVGLVAAAIFAVFPNIVYHTAVPLTETLFMFLVATALLLLLSGDWRARRLEPWRLVAFGLVVGYSGLVRPISLPFLLIMLIVMLAWGFGWRRSIQYAALAGVAAVAVILPWSIRNFIVMDSPVIISTNLGDDLCMGHYPGATGHFALPDFCFAGYEHLERSEVELKRDHDNTRRAIRFAVDHPVAEAKLIVKKARWLWDQDHDGLDAAQSYGDDEFIGENLHTALIHVADGYFFIVMALGGVGIAGLVYPLWEPRRMVFLLAMLFVSFVPLLFFGDARFHVPAVPFVSVTAAWTIVMAWRMAPRLVAPPPRDA
ncbi:MAG: glycosyltransferase family 39 protein [Dehalococcoidia bacterium]